jgi:hypothetical protein
MEQPQNTKPTGPMRILRRWLAMLAELPLLRHEPLMTDDDCDAAGDIIYLRGLLDEILAECERASSLWPDCTYPQLRPIPAEWSAALDAALILVANDFVTELAA